MYAVKYSIIQNLPVATKTAFLCVSSLSFELHGAFSGNNEKGLQLLKINFKFQDTIFLSIRTHEGGGGGGNNWKDGT